MPAPAIPSPAAGAKLNVSGVWVDNYSYSWTLFQKAGAATIAGSLVVAGCPDSTWTVTGSVTSETAFSLTATNPDGGDDTCVSAFTYTLTVSSPGVAAGTWTNTGGASGTVTIQLQAAGNLTFLNPGDQQTFSLDVNYLATSPIPFAAQSSDTTDAITWNLTLSYATSGGLGNYSVTVPSFTTMSGASQDQTFKAEGGQLAIMATQASNTANESITVAGSCVPASSISPELLSLYSGGATPTLLQKIATQESTYQQFIDTTLYGEEALWPDESYATGVLASGSHIGLMQVPLSLSNAFDWVANAKAGAAVFASSLRVGTKHLNDLMLKYPTLPSYTPTMLESEALSLYTMGTAKKYDYWRVAVDSKTGQASWEENSKANPIGTAYADSVMAQAVPSQAPCE